MFNLLAMAWISLGLLDFLSLLVGLLVLLGFLDLLGMLDLLGLLDLLCLLVVDWLVSWLLADLLA